MTDTVPVAIPFACPRCDRELDRIENGHRCEGFKVDFPLVGGVPWLFAEPGSALAEWRTRFDYLQKVLRANSERYREAARRHRRPAGYWFRPSSAGDWPVARARKSKV